MKHLLLAIALLCAPICLFGDPQNTLVIRVDINILEMAEKDIKDYGIEQSTLYDQISKHFASANIQVRNDPDLPKFVLQIKSLPSDHTIATFIQGFFYEEAIHARSKKAIWAITWSQSGIVTGSKESYTKNVQEEVMNIVNSFILDNQRQSQVTKGSS